METKPFSKTKKWRVTEVVERARWSKKNLDLKSLITLVQNRYFV
jgi:hypothetical protein